MILSTPNPVLTGFGVIFYGQENPGTSFKIK